MKNIKNIQNFFSNPLNEETSKDGYRVEYTTKDGEKLKSGVYKTKKEADDKHWKLAKDNKLKSINVVKVKGKTQEGEIQDIVIQIQKLRDYNNEIFKAKSNSKSDSTRSNLTKLTNSNDSKINKLGKKLSKLNEATVNYSHQTPTSNSEVFNSIFGDVMSSSTDAEELMSIENDQDIEVHIYYKHIKSNGKTYLIHVTQYNKTGISRVSVSEIKSVDSRDRSEDENIGFTYLDTKRLGGMLNTAVTWDEEIQGLKSFHEKGFYTPEGEYINETKTNINESSMSDLDAIAQDSTDFKDFAKKIFSDSELKGVFTKTKETLKYLKKLYDVSVEEASVTEDLDDDAKIHFMQKVTTGEIDTLPEDPKAEYMKLKLQGLIGEALKKSRLSEGEEKIDTVVDELSDEMSDIIKGLESELSKEETIDEGLLTTASIVIALPAILGLISKAGKGASKLINKVLGKKPTEAQLEDAWFAKLGKIADNLHHLYMRPIERVVGKFVKDKKKAHRISNIIFHVIVATFLVASGATAVKALQAKNVSLTTLESALTAIKGGEIQAFIADAIAEVGEELADA